MRTSLEQSVLTNIRSQRMIAPGDRVAAAVSGGADSVALLRILEKARGELGITLTVVHFDHRLRGEESDRDAQFVAELARSHGLEFFPDSANVAGEAERNGWNLEDAARRLRYGFFQRVIEGGHATRVAVAHTADDQAETVLAHVIRGTGPTGIGGIYPIVGRIVRPLLGIRRNELREYLIALKQPWREDATNHDQKRLRSRIRGQLLPGIERDFSPRIVEHLCELAQLSREEGVFWDALVEDRFRALASAKRAGDEAEEQVVSARDLLHPVGQSAGVARDGNGADSRSMEPWRALTERLIRRLYQDVRGDRRELTSRHIEQVIQLAGKSTSGRSVRLPGGVRVAQRFGDLVFSSGTTGETAGATKETNSRRSAYQYFVIVGTTGTATVCVREIGVRFRLKTIDWAGTRRDTIEDHQVLDANSLSAPLILRNWRPGDAYTPHGRRQPRKLKQMFLAARIPSEARRKWPVLESAGRVIWSRGMPAADGFCANEGTRVGLVIEEEGM